MASATRITIGHCIPLTVLMLIGLAGCDKTPVGRKCFVGGNDAGAITSAVVASPALECKTRTCLSVPRERELPMGSEYAPLCTDECSSEGDCEKDPKSPCQLGFACTVPVTTGPFCCRKMCVCKDYILIPDGGLPAPAACDPSNPANTCVNLEGR